MTAKAPIRLAEVVSRLEERVGAARVVGDPDLLVHSVAYDHREVEPGALFCCLPGEKHDGHEYGREAVAAGAASLICERELPELHGEATEVIVEIGCARAAMAHAACAVAGDPASHLTTVGITGTNGKTTTTFLLGGILEAAGYRAGLIGTLSGARTTPESPDLQSQLVAMLEAARDAAVPGAVAMEITSHALVQHRPDGYLHDLAVFTNLSQDHLDYHGTMEAYYQAKRILFTKQHARRGVVNADDEHGRRLLEESEIPVEAFSMEDVEDVRTSGEGSSFRLFGEEVRLPLLGALNIRNAVAAAASARALGIDVTTIGEGLRQVGQVPGRLEKVGNALGLTAVVDYAHTPAGLVEVCRTLRDLLPTGGRLVVVFGAGGDRDREKRPLMGDAVSKGADLAVLTSDNPRHEDPLTIIDEVKAGWKSAGELHVEVDRRRAILLALELAERADVVLVAGKGHETTQQVGDEFIALDDRKVIVEEAERLAGAA